MWRLYIIFTTCIICLTNCTQTLPEAETVKCMPDIYPDYREITIPYNIAPLNFKLKKPAKSIAVLSNKKNQLFIYSKNGIFKISQKKWHKLTKSSIGNAIEVVLYVQNGEKVWLRYSPFSINVAKEPIDSYLVYRRIAPGYRLWGEMGIYQRCLESFNEKTILNNKFTNNNCMNCHSFCMQNSDEMLFHQRTTYGGTYLIINGKIEKLNTKTKETISALVYPSWHPSGQYVAFSTNDTKQDFHLSDPNRIEVFDSKSDVVVYDIKKHEIVTSALLFSPDNMETFPTFSPDGKRLFFCSTPIKPMPESFRDVKYNLLSIAFNPLTRSFGTVVDTLYNSSQRGHSVQFPRVSPDGRYLLYTVSGYGNFSIWHKDADLQMIDLMTGRVDSLSNVNSDDVESYHSWSSNSSWFVFSSRRENGLYTHIYICHIDEKGIAGKPFLLPQENPDYYDLSLFSFNIPELIRSEVKARTNELIQVSKHGKSKDIIFVGN